MHVKGPPRSSEQQRGRDVTPSLEDRIRQRAYFLSVNGGESGDEANFWLGAERELMAEVGWDPQWLPPN